MFLARRPSPDAIDRFLRDSRDLAVAPMSIGLADAPAGHPGVDDVARTILVHRVQHRRDVDRPR